MSRDQQHPWPNFSQEEAEAVERVLLSNRVNYWTGEECRKFEQEFAAFAGTKHAIAVANGTVALELALHGLGIGERNGGSSSDEVIVTPRSFIASVSCVVNAGAVPVFADVDRHTQNISADNIRAVVTENTRAVLCVHLSGWPCDMDAIRSVTEPRGIRLIEDCAQAHGASYKGKPAGSLGDVAAWSFCQDKIMTTGGEGGMITCSDEAVWQRMWSYKDHGKDHEKATTKGPATGFRWVHDSFGSNYRMLEMQAAIGRIQLKRMPQWHSERAANAAAVRRMLEPYSGENGWLRVPIPDDREQDEISAGPPDCEHAWYRIYAFIRPENLPEGWSRDRVAKMFSDQGLPCMQGICPEIYLEKAFDGTSLRPAQRLPVARELGDTSLMFLVHPGMTYPQIEFPEELERV